MGLFLEMGPGMSRNPASYRPAPGTCYTTLAMERERSDAYEERVLRRVPLEILAAAAVLAIPAALLFDPLTGLLFLAGGALAALGFTTLKRSLSKVLDRGREGALRSGIALYALRLVLICAVFFLIILLYPKKIVAFGAGFSMIVLVSLGEGVRALLLMKTWKD
jgi:hypothetical protein